MPRPRIAVLCSGRGTNLEAIIRSIREGRLKAAIGVVVSDNPRALALTRALKAKIPAVLIDPRSFKNRSRFDRELARVIDRAKVRLVVLAGFMRLLSPWFVRRYRFRIVNIHPALLPAFPGAHAVRDALAYGAKVTGVTVHFVDEKVDHGPVILQEAVRVEKGDTEAALHARIHGTEHKLYPQAIQSVLAGKMKIKGRNVIPIHH